MDVMSFISKQGYWKSKGAKMTEKTTNIRYFNRMATVEEKTLTDGSKVYDVRAFAGLLTFEAVDEKAAEQLARALEGTIGFSYNHSDR